ncbi:YggT family protein [Brevundimonas sp.]|uniref:YggT family protein n=1 Tax=Brevundimonas sp. TaxID=1871086 RepID=UPI002D2D13A5|nr:YggT family protein [Brevundimonas sp.]HYC67632.1 YggT family protein [Brevundimonas sp.]
MGYAIVWLVNTVLGLMTWAIILSAILSWLFAFDVINHRNRFVNQVAAFLDALTGPILAPFRKIIPPLGGLDITPIVAILTLQFLGILFNRMSAPFLIQMLG